MSKDKKHTNVICMQAFKRVAPQKTRRRTCKEIPTLEETASLKDIRLAYLELHREFQLLKRAVARILHGVRGPVH